MQDDEAYLHRLELQPNSSEKEVRRAYARELKKLDLEQQPQAFEALREAYEYLLSAAREATSSSPSASPMQSVQHRTPHAEPSTSDVPEAQSKTHQHAVFAELEAQLRDQPFVTQLEAAQFLHRCLEDPRLISLDARTAFEGDVVALLVRGWRPGHEFLFNAAVDCFDWSEMRQGLLRFGPSGRFMDAAIDEMLISEAVPLSTRVHYRRIVKALCRTERPVNTELMASLPTAEYLAEYFPHWMQIVCREDALPNWRAWDEELSEALAQTVSANNARAEGAPTRRTPGVFERFKKTGVRFLWVVIGSVALVFIARIAQGIYANVHAEQVVVTLLTPPSNASNPKPNDQSQPTYEQTVAREIRAHMQIPQASSFQGNKGAEYYVVLKPTGEIEAIQFVLSSGDSQWDRMSYWALKETKALPLKADGTVSRKMLIVLEPGLPLPQPER